MAEAYIVDAVRSPVGRRGGGLAQVHPADLGAHSLTALVERTGIDPAAVEDVVFGNVDSIGGQAGDIARTCWLAAGLPEHVPGTTVDRQCGSSQQAVHFAAQAVLSGTMDVVVAGRRAADVADPHLVGDDRRPAVRLRRPVLRVRGLGGPLRHAGGQPVPLGRDDRREVGHLPRGHGGVRGRVARAGHPGPGRGALRRRDRPARRRHRRRGPPRAELGQDPLAAHPHRGRARHRRLRVADLRRVGRPADRQRAGPRRPRAHAAGPHPPPVGAGRRPGVDAHRPDPGHGARAGEDRHDARRHRPGRDQRGVRLGRHRLGPRDRGRPRAGSTSTAAPSPSATRSAPRAPA